MSSYTREVKFAAAYDKRSPDPRKNYGIHGVHITFTLKHPVTRSGLTFSISTNWHLPHVQAETDANPPRSASVSPYLFHKPQAFGVDSHRPPQEGDIYSLTNQCDVTGGSCCSDGSGLLGEEFLQTLIAGGDEALWARMEEQHKRWCL